MRLHVSVRGDTETAKVSQKCQCYNVSSDDPDERLDPDYPTFRQYAQRQCGNAAFHNRRPSVLQVVIWFTLGATGIHLLLSVITKKQEVLSVEKNKMPDKSRRI